MESLDETPSEADSGTDEIETPSTTESTCSTVDTGMGGSLAADFDGEQVTADEMLRSPELDHLRLHGDSTVSEADEAKEETEEGDLFNYMSTAENLANRKSTRSLSDPGQLADKDTVSTSDTAWTNSRDTQGTYDFVPRKDSDGLEQELTSSNDDDVIRTESISTQEIRLLVERSFQIDAVACSGVPLVHCTRLMCSFLLSGNPGEMLSDSSVRVSVKSLALSCIAQAVKLYPEAFLVRVLPESSGESDEEEMHRSSPQLVRDILLFSHHGDPQLRGSLAAVIGSVIRTGLKKGRCVLITALFLKGATNISWSSDNSRAPCAY